MPSRRLSFSVARLSWGIVRHPDSVTSTGDLPVATWPIAKLNEYNYDHAAGVAQTSAVEVCGFPFKCKAADPSLHSGRALKSAGPGYFAAPTIVRPPA